MNIILKWLRIPVTNEIKEIQVPQLWSVRWKSRFGSYGGDIKPEAEFFTSESEAEAFKVSLKNAFLLLRYVGYDETQVTIQKES